MSEQRCNYPDCDGGPATGYCHKDCRSQNWTPEALIAFEQDIAAEFNAGKIRAPIHLDGGNEQQLIEVFKDVRPQDWVCGSWRQHYKCLLKGVPPHQLKTAIMAGHSITLCFPEYRIISSAIVGGIVPIALGLALAIKRGGGLEQVYCFVGDMTARTGIFLECLEYAHNNSLPIRFIIEDNGISVSTPTEAACGDPVGIVDCLEYEGYGSEGMLQRYGYHLNWPHSGAGRRVEF